MDLKEKVVIITGASEGIGLETARLLSGCGAKAVIAARSIDKLKDIEKQLEGSFAVKTDMRNPDDVTNLIKQTVNKFGRIDVLVNNAGQGVHGPVEGLNLELYKEVFELNVVAVIDAMQKVIPVMRSQGSGIIVNISSRVSKNYFPFLGGYASTKYALNCISLTAREELAKDNIIVSVVHPKLTLTNFQKNSIDYDKDKLSWLGRPGMEADTPDKVAGKIKEIILTGAAEIEL